MELHVIPDGDGRMARSVSAWSGSANATRAEIGIDEAFVLKLWKC